MNSVTMKFNFCTIIYQEKDILMITGLVNCVTYIRTDTGQSENREHPLAALCFAAPFGRGEAGSITSKILYKMPIYNFSRIM